MSRRPYRSVALGVLLIGASLILTTSGLAQAPAQPVTPEEFATSVELTVYNQNLGLVKETRTLMLTEGTNEVRFTDVAAKIKPTSVQVVSLTDPGGTTVLEQNYEYDIVSSEKLLQKYVDREITLTTEDGTTYTGTLLSGRGDIILATEEGIKMVRLGQVREFSFPTLPEGLITKPTLVWLLRASETGEQPFQVTYLTDGINWSADYVATLAAGDVSLALTGWVTLDNRTGTSYQDAKLKLVAGDIHRVTGVAMDVYEMARGMAIPEMAPQVTERAFFEYHMYEVQRPVTVRDAQTKQVEFVTAPEVGVAKVYVYQSTPFAYYPHRGRITDPGYGASSDSKVQVRLELTNDEESGLGIPLPRGTVRVYQEDIDGGAEFVGEDYIDHTPRNEDISLLLGNAFDLVGERKQVAFRKLGERLIEETIEISLRNRKQEDDVTIRIIENLFRAQDSEIIRASHDYEMVNAHTARFEVPVSADGESTVTYTVRYRW